MTDIKPVIATTDGSSHSLRAVAHAGRISGAIGAGLEVMRIVEESDLDGGSDAAVAQGKERLEAELQRELRREGLDGKAVIESPGKDESVTAAILRNARNASILAMNTRGKGVIASLLHGSVALGVLGKTETPVMLTGPEILGPPVAGDAYRLLVTTDCSEDSSNVLRALAPLLEGGKFKVTLFFVHEHAPSGTDNAADLQACEATMQRQRALLPASLDVELATRDIPRGGGVDTAILEKARDLDADAIAMSTHGQGARKHAIMGSTAMATLGRSPVPVIVARV
jgi:nucleotide-binding universal stress UspA family protein